MTHYLPNGPDLWDRILAQMPPGAFIGGGAIRDWYLGVEPKDIDVFINARKDAPMLPGFYPLGSDRAAEYTALNEIACIQRGVLEQRTVDLIYIQLPEEETWYFYPVMMLFDFGITRCAYDGQIQDTTFAAHDRANQTVTLMLRDRPRRALERFDRFNARWVGTYNLVDTEGKIIFLWDLVPDGHEGKDPFADDPQTQT